MNNLINWSEVSRLLTSDRTAIRSNYSGKMYKEVISDIKKLNKLIEIRISDFKKLGI